MADSGKGTWGHTFNREGKKVKVYIPDRSEEPGWRGAMARHITANKAQAMRDMISKEKKLKESKDDWQVGDNVHIGFGAKGGSGMFGTIHKVHDHEVEVKSRDKHYSGITKKHDHKIWKGPKKFLTRNESEENCRNKLNEWGGLVKLATTAVQAIARASGTAGGGTAIGTLVRRGSDTIRKTIDKYTNNKDKKYTTGGQFGADGKFTTGGTAPDYTQGSFKREATDMNEGYASGREAVKKMLDANKAKARQTILGSGMSKAAKAADVEQSDREYIRQKQAKAKTEGYAGGAQISHNHGNPAPDLTKDTKVSTNHRPGRSTSRPGTATPPSYGTKARDLTKNSNPHTRHKPLTAGRIREMTEAMKKGHSWSFRGFKGQDVSLSKASKEEIAKKKAKAQTGQVKEDEDMPKAKELRDIVGEGWAFSGYKGKTDDDLHKTMSDIKGKADSAWEKMDHAGQKKHMADYAVARGLLKLRSKKAKNESIEETTKALMEMYDAPGVVGGSKESQKLQEFSQHANEYHYNKRMSEHHHKMGGDHEDEHGETHLGKYHYHTAMAHESKMHHHADQLVKDHGMDRGKIGHLCWKHRDSAHDFTLALAQEGKEPVKQPKPNRGRIFRK